MHKNLSEGFNINFEFMDTFLDLGDRGFPKIYNFADYKAVKALKSDMAAA